MSYLIWSPSLWPEKFGLTKHCQHIHNNLLQLEIAMITISVFFPAETSSLTEQIRHGKLRPILDLGVVPSQVSLVGGGGSESGGEEWDGGAVPEESKEGGEGATAAVKEVRSYCIPLQSLGLGGNKITSLGAGYLADGLKTNTSECILIS